MKQLLAIALFAFATLFAGNASANYQPQDINWMDKHCCCKAGCPEGSYFCRVMCTSLGGSCRLSADSLPDGISLTADSSRAKCTGATWVWNWFSSGVECPKACPANSSDR